MAFEAGTFARCKHCSGTKLQRKGIDNGRQRYRCAPCDYTFVSSVMVTPTAPPVEGIACDRCSGPVYPKGHDKHGRPRVSCIPCQHIFITAEHRPGKQPVFIEGVPCLICEGDKVVSAGFSNTGKKRYACVPCDYTFTAVEERLKPGPRLIGARRPFRPKAIVVKEKKPKPKKQKADRVKAGRVPAKGKLTRLVRPRRPTLVLPRLLTAAKYSVLGDLLPKVGKGQDEVQRLRAARDICIGFVTSATGVPAAMILNEVRGETLHSDARHLAMYLMNVVLGEPHAAVGRAFDRDRTIVRYALRRVEDARDYPHVEALVARLELMAAAVLPFLEPRPLAPKRRQRKEAAQPRPTTPGKWSLNADSKYF